MKQVECDFLLQGSGIICVYQYCATFDIMLCGAQFSSIIKVFNLKQKKKGGGGYTFSGRSVTALIHEPFWSYE